MTCSATRSRAPAALAIRFERDPAAVARDVKNEVVSRAAAQADYGVVIGEDGAIDPAATARLRAELRTARGWTAVPTVRRD